MSDCPASTATTDEHVDVTLIDAEPTNQRRTKPGAVEDALFERSVASFGVIQPIILRAKADGRFALVAGARRLAAATKAGHARIPATVHHDMDDLGAQALQAVENAHRAPMHPIDTWRAMVTLQESGMSLALAGQCLGLTDARARQLDRLGRIAPPLIDAMHIVGIPDDDDLAGIANAPQADQARVFAAHVKGRVTADTRIAWWTIANDLTSAVIPIGHAIFDTDKVTGITWQEDVFAEPGGKAVFTTMDRRAFMAAQAAALAEKVGKRRKRGEKVEMVEVGRDNRLLPPTGFDYCYDKPKSLKLPDSDPRKLVTGILRDGRVEELLVVAKGKRVPKPGAKGGAATSNDEDDDTPDAPARPARAAPAAEKPARIMTDAGFAMLAAAKSRAIAQRLADDHDTMQLATLMRLLCMAFCAANVKITPQNETYSRVDMRDVMARLVRPDGRLDLSGSMAELKAIAAEIVTRVATISHIHGGGAGAAGVIIGDAIAAADCLEPLDTEAFLATLSLATLKDAALAADITGAKTSAALRERLVGKIGTRWRPAEAEFRPAPLGAARDAFVAKHGGDDDGTGEDDNMEEAA